MNQGMTVAVAVAGGYVLGRTKKGKKAIKVALWLAGKNRTTLVRAGLSRVGGLPGAQDILDQVRGPLVAAARQAAISTFENRVGHLSDALRERTRSLSAGDSGDEDRPAGGDKAADEDATAPAPEKRKPATRKASTAGGAPSKSTSAAGRTSSRSAGKSAAQTKTAQAKTSGAAKSSTSGKGTASKRSASNEGDRSAPGSRQSTRSRSGGTRSRTSSPSSSRSSTSKGDRAAGRKD